LSEAAGLAAFTVYGGDFKAGRCSYLFKKFTFKPHSLWQFDETVPLDQLVSLETISLESDGRSTLSTVGRALVGDLIAGPFGAIIAAGTAKGRNQVTFLATFDDKRQFMGATDSETFKTWAGYLLTRKRAEEKSGGATAEEEAKKVARTDALIARYIEEQKVTVPLVDPQNLGSDATQNLDPRNERQLHSRSTVPTFGKRKSLNPD
jgi:hypothetical protein